MAGPAETGAVAVHSAVDLPDVATFPAVVSAAASGDIAGGDFPRSAATSRSNW
jgi:hypothetical protein